MDYHPRQKIVGREVAVVSSGGSTVAIVNYIGLAKGSEIKHWKSFDHVTSFISSMFII